LATQRSDNHYEEAHMSRIATLTAVLTMVVAPAAFAGPTDLRSPDVRDIATPAVVDLRSPDAIDPVQVAGQDLRSPDAVDGFVATAPTAQAAPSDGADVSPWAITGLVAAALAACGSLAVMLRRHRQVGRAVGV
jgi:hypothetical protein